MLSTDNNINHFNRSTPDFAVIRDAIARNIFRPISRLEFDLLQTKDPGTTYIITDARPGEPLVYYGGACISKNENKPEYLLGINDHDEYEIYEKLTNGYGIIIDIVAISRFKNAQDAIDTLRSYKRAGSADKYALTVHNALGAYIQKECGIHECIMSLLAAKGYRNDPHLQLLNEKAIAFGYRTDSRDIPKMMRAMLNNIADNEPIRLFKWYARLYDVFVYYEFFVDKKYTEPLPEELDLHEEIARVIGCFE